MKLRKYNQFINESVEIIDEVIDVLVERGKFWNELTELDCSEFNFRSNYSDMCKRKGANPEEDFEKIQKHFDEMGFTLEKIKYLFSDENNKKCGYNLKAFYQGGSRILNSEPLKSVISGVKKKLSSSDYKKIYTQRFDKSVSIFDIIEPFSTGASLDSQNAVVDVYLYFLFQKLGAPGIVWLGGYSWANYDLNSVDDEYSEAFIRYRYGYHQTEYGKLWMEQCGLDKKWFEDKAIDDLQKYLNNEFVYIVEGVDRSKDIRSLSFDNYSIIENERIIINLSKLEEDIKKCPKDKYYTGKETYSVDVEKIAAEFVKELEGFSLEIELADNDDLIIWGIFKED